MDRKSNDTTRWTGRAMTRLDGQEEQ